MHFYVSLSFLVYFREVDVCSYIFMLVLPTMFYRSSFILQIGDTTRHPKTQEQFYFSSYFSWLPTFYQVTFLHELDEYVQFCLGLFCSKMQSWLFGERKQITNQVGKIWRSSSSAYNLIDSTKFPRIIANCKYGEFNLVPFQK